MKTSSQSVHHAAAEGYQANADRYVKGRPDYPPEVADWLRETIGLHAGMTAVDLGAGTWKFGTSVHCAARHRCECSTGRW